MNNNISEPVRTRIAPSPTGFLHIGSLRTALTNYLFAKKNNGVFLVRLEDTDRKRFVPGSTEDLVRSLRWAGLTWQEGVDLDQDGKVIEKGDFGPYTQSHRLETYQKYVQELIAKEKAYYCFCSQERLEEVRKERTVAGMPPKYDRHCLTLPQSEIKARLKNKESFVIRLRVPEGEQIVFNDLVRGKITIGSDILDDQVLMKSDGYPTYHLAVVVDDYLMKITHVLRAEEWLSSTPKHILIYRAFGWPLPQFGHLPQLLNLNGKKLSKRDGDVSVRDFIKKGYLPQAIINFIALLGWNPKTTEEFFSLKDLEEAFDFKKINKAGAKFDYGRLNWFNAQYLKKLSEKEYLEVSQRIWEANHLPEQFLDQEKRERIALVQRERTGDPEKMFTEVEYLIRGEIDYAPELLFWKQMTTEEIKNNLEKAKQVIESLSDKEYNLASLTEALLVAAGDNRGEFLWPLRSALTGEKKSPSPFECAWVLGKKESIKRINQAINLI
jgi:nondiscriminating glutamyl-tRNA synthetase